MLTDIAHSDSLYHLGSDANDDDLAYADEGSAATGLGQVTRSRSHGAQTSVSKALTLLDAFNASRVVLGVSELASRSHLPKSTAHRLLAVLIERHYIQRVGDRYCLTDRMFELGNQVSICRPNGLRERAAPFMAELFAETHETVHLAVLRGTEVLYIEKIFGHGATPCATTVGTRKAAYCTALGKAILAFADAETVQINLASTMRRHTPYTLTQPGQLQLSLQRIRHDGVATDLEESKLGVTCVAAPLRDPASGQPIAAVSITSVTARGDIRRFTPRLRRVTEALSARLTSPVLV